MRGLGSPVRYAAAVGAATGCAGIPLGDALTAYLEAMAANLASAGLRLGMVGQTNGQRILAALEPIVGAAVARPPRRLDRVRLVPLGSCLRK